MSICYDWRVMISQSAGAITFLSIVTEPISSAMIFPEVGFLIFVMAPLMSAFTVEYSKARSQSLSNVQF